MRRTDGHGVGRDSPGATGKKGHHVLFKREKGDGVWVAKIYEPVDRPFCQTTAVKEEWGFRSMGFNIGDRNGARWLVRLSQERNIADSETCFQICPT